MNHELNIKVIKHSERLDQEKIIIIINAWSKSRWVYKLIARGISKNFGYMQYFLPMNILTADVDLTREKFHLFVQKVMNDIQELTAKKEREIYVVGQSLGTNLAMMLVDQINVKKVVLTVPGVNLPEALWAGVSTQFIRRKMEKQGIDLIQLKKRWADISPDYYFKKFGLKPEYLIRLSKIDRTIPYTNGLRLVELMKSKKIKVKVEETFIATHALSCGLDGFFPKRFISFFKE